MGRYTAAVELERYECDLVRDLLRQEAIKITGYVDGTDPIDASADELHAMKEYGKDIWALSDRFEGAANAIGSLSNAKAG